MTATGLQEQRTLARVLCKPYSAVSLLHNPWVQREHTFVGSAMLNSVESWVPAPFSAIIHSLAHLFKQRIFHKCHILPHEKNQ